MNKQRNDSGRGGSGPVTTEELESLLDRGYGLSSHRFIAEAWGLEPDAEAEKIAERAEGDSPVREKLEDLEDLVRVILSRVIEEGGRLRGENLRRDLLLRGFGDVEDLLRQLVVDCVLLPLPNPGESELDVENLLEKDNYLQRDLALPITLESTLEAEHDLDREAVRSWEGDIEQILDEDIDSLELNLLHLASLLEREPLRLNKSGAPNRRSLGRFARGITLPGDPGEAGEDLDLNDAEQLDYITFLLAMAFELGFVDRHDETIEGDYEAVSDYFLAGERKRNRKLNNAFQGLKHWSEVESLSLAEAKRRPDYEEHFSQSEETGEPFIGARGYVLSVLRRSQLTKWTTRQSVVELCTQLDRNYLPRTLSNIESDVEPAEYIEAVLDRGLRWLGVLEVAHADDGTELLRFNRRGAKILGLKDIPKDLGDEEQEDAEPGADDDGCLVVQPNFEVMLFLDNAPLETLYYLYHVGTRDKLADRVANFRLTAESVQWGYSHGLNAEKVKEILDEYSHAPVPDTVSFQLDDWQRVHRKLKLYANGILMRHADPDQLDLIVGQLEHDWRDVDIDTARLGPSSVFIGHEDPPGLDRVVEQNESLDIDYLGEIPPCLYFVDSLEVMIDPLETDLVTLSELKKIADKLGDDDDDGGSDFYELKIGKIQRRWEENPLENVIEFLDARTVGGIPPAQVLKLKGKLDKPLEATVSENVTVVVLENPTVAEHFMKIPECDSIIRQRLGDVAFTIDTEDEDALEELFDDLGVNARFQ